MQLHVIKDINVVHPDLFKRKIVWCKYDTYSLFSSSSWFCFSRNDSSSKRFRLASNRPSEVVLRNICLFFSFNCQGKLKHQTEFIHTFQQDNKVGVTTLIIDQCANGVQSSIMGTKSKTSWQLYWKNTSAHSKIPVLGTAIHQVHWPGDISLTTKNHFFPQVH